MRHLRVASTTLLALAALAAAETAAPPKAPAREYTTQPTRTIALAETNAAQIASVALYVTDDGGRTWRKDQELPVSEGATALPTFTFAAPRDGAFGLWTVATRRDGSAEAAPVAGAAPKLELVVDRAAPALDLLDATLGGVSGGQATLALSWKIADPNLAAEPVSIELSTDQGRTFAARHSGAATGTTALNVPVDAATVELQVRVIARDLAGNVLTSAARAVPLPVEARPADPEAALAAAVAALPAPAELGVAGRSGSPIVSAGTSPLAAPEADAATPAKPTDAATPAKPADAAAPAPVDGEVVADRDVEARYAQQAGSPVEAPRGRRADVAPEDTAPAKPAGPPANRPAVTDPGAAFLVGAAASAALQRARQADTAGDVETAHLQYLRLHRSSVAKTALAEQLALLRRIGDHATTLALVGQLPPELRTDAARLAAARASLALGDAATAVAWAAKVRAAAGEAREALLVLGQALSALDRKPEARRIFEQLASGDDEVAAQARALR